MSSHFFPDVERWSLPSSAFSLSLRELARDGARGCESIALWLGRRAQGEARVSHVVGVRGGGVLKAPAFLQIQSSMLNDVTDMAIQLGLVLVGQIHSHPGLFVDLSPTDRAHGVSVHHYLSVVAPGYALDPATTLADCGVHVFEARRGYRRLTGVEVTRRVRIDVVAEAHFLTVGEAA